MAIAFDASAKSSGSGINTLTFAHTCSGSDRALVVNVVCDNSDKVTGVTYNGVGMTQVSKLQNTTSRFTYLYLLLGPATGANNIVVSTSSLSYIEGNSASYTGVKQTGQPDATGSNSASSGTSLTTSLTTIADNCWTVLSALGQGGGIAAGSGATLRISQLVGAILDSNGVVSPAGSKSMAHTQTASHFMVGLMLSLEPSVAVASSIAMQRAFPRAILNF